MMLKAGAKLHSAVCDTQVIVVKAPAVDVELGCGGAPLLADGEEAPAGATLDTSIGDAALLGKRYADDELGLELLVSKAGGGALTCNGTPLPVKGAKPLPASD
jgi:hypothetical protein